MNRYAIAALNVLVLAMVLAAALYAPTREPTHADIVYEVLSDRDMIVHMVREEAARTYVEGETPEQTARRAELAGQNAASIIYGMVKNENRAEEWLALKRYGEN